MTNAMNIIEMLRIIDNRAKFMGIKLTMMRNLLEKYKDNEELLKEVLKLTEGTRLHELILEAYPPLEELEKKLKEEELKNIPITKEEEKTKAGEEIRAEGYTFIGRVPPIVYIKEYLRKFYFGNNIKKIFYDMGKDYAHWTNIDEFDEMIDFMKDEFGEVSVERSEPLSIIVKNSKEALNCKYPEPVCYFTAGFLAGCLENIVERKYIVEVIEEKCIAMGDPYCLFIAKKSLRL